MDIKRLRYAYSCSTGTEHIDYGQQQPHEGGIATFYPLLDMRFTISTCYTDRHAGTDKDTCPSALTRRSCEIRPALVQFSITVLVFSAKELGGKNVSPHIKFLNNNLSRNVGITLDEIRQIDVVNFLKYTNLLEQSKETFTIGRLAHPMNHLYGSSLNLTLHEDTEGIVFRDASLQTIFHADINTLQRPLRVHHQ